MKNIKFLAIPALLATLVGCVNGDDYGTPDLSEKCTTLTVTKEVTDITDVATGTPTQYLDPIDGSEVGVIEAYVTSSDEGGNFYKSISFVSGTEDDAVGFTIPVDNYNLYTKYEPGRKVYIRLNNLYYNFDTQTDSYQLGNLYQGNDIGRLSGVEFENILARGCDDQKIDEEMLVRHMTVAEAKNDANMHKLIEFDNVQFSDLSLGKKYFDPSLNSIGGATNHTLTDAEGNTIIVRVSEYSIFASTAIPSGSGKVRGVLTKYGSDYQFMIRTINDVKLDNSRIVPLFEESFDSNFPTWTKYSVIGAQVWGSAAFGNPAPCAVMNGFSSGNQNNEDWLISPALDLSTLTSTTLSFQTSTRFNGAPLQVFISTNYDGSSAPSTATWTQLTGFNLPVWTSGSFTPWTTSGGIDLTSYVGNANVRIAFKYTSNTTAAAAWEVDNVKLIGQ